MVTIPEHLEELIRDEISVLTDQRLITQIDESLIKPLEVLLNWDYGEVGERHRGWSVFEHKNSGTAIAYCEYGHGPENPWGLIGLSDDVKWMGPDSGWFRSFLAAYLDGFAPTHLDIWRVFKTVTGGAVVPVSAEAGWNETWLQVARMRELEPAANFDCKCDAEVELSKLNRV